MKNLITMGYLCDFCGEQRSIVYCQSDAASLCLSCDRNVHSANALSKQHSRTLVCERCNSQPALVRCVDERISMCQNCDWMGHAGSNVTPAHKKQAVNCYSGCPSAAELSEMWSFILDYKRREDQGHDHQETNIAEESSLRIEASELLNVNVDKASVWMDSSTPIAGSSSSAMRKVVSVLNYFFCTNT